MESKKIFVLGGDGFCGWPTSLYFSELGHEVFIIDNLSRRNIDNELQVESLTPIYPISKRLEIWNSKKQGEKINFIHLDIARDYCELLHLLKYLKPQAIVHFAEQRAAPYSMKTSKSKRYTINNNINATHNLLCSIVESKIKTNLIHLGTMGVYGYGTADMKIPEGYLNIYPTKDSSKPIEILYPSNPGSIYHLTKTMDQLMFAYYTKNDSLTITDLHQGIVWGTETKHTSIDERLINRFDYDGDYGTVLNRFLMQAALNYPLTVHGSGKQTRAFININDTIECLRIALENPPKDQKVKIMNQMTETHRLIDLANMIQNLTGVEIQHISNPRNEADENDLNVENNTLLNYGLNPVFLNEKIASEIENIALKYLHRCDKSKILCTSRWN